MTTITHGLTLEQLELEVAAMAHRYARYVLKTDTLSDLEYETLTRQARAKLPSSSPVHHPPSTLASQYRTPHIEHARNLARTPRARTPGMIGSNTTTAEDLVRLMVRRIRYELESQEPRYSWGLAVSGSLQEKRVTREIDSFVFAGMAAEPRPRMDVLLTPPGTWSVFFEHFTRSQLETSLQVVFDCDSPLSAQRSQQHLLNLIRVSLQDL